MPTSAKSIQLKYLARICNGMDKSGVESPDGTIPIYGSGGQFSTATHALYTGDSVLLGRKGTIDKPLFVSGSFWTVDTMYYTKINQELIDPKFFFYLCNTINFEYYKSGSVLPSMTKEDLGAIKFRVMPLDKQQKIREHLDKKLHVVDLVINSFERRLELIGQYRQSLITRAVTKGLDPNVEMKDSGYDIANNIPIHWVTIKLQYLCKLATGNQDTQDAVPDGQYPFYVRSPTIERTNHVTYSGTGILMAGDGVGAGKVFHYAEGQYGIHQRVYLLSEISDLIDPKYLFFYIKTIFSCEVERGTAKSTVPSIRMPMLTRFLVCVPPKREQIEIMDYCQKVEEKTEAISEDIKNNIHLLKEYRSSLISAAVTGQLAIEEAAE